MAQSEGCLWGHMEYVGRELDQDVLSGMCLTCPG